MGDLERFSTHAARKLAEKYADVKSEKQFDQSFWRDMFINVCGIDDLLATGIEFQYPVRSKETGTIKFIDVLWPTVALIEHKSAGADLDKAFLQATEYWISLEASHRPPYIIVSDFARIRIIEVESDESFEFALVDLPDNIHRIEGVIGDSGVKASRVEVAADTKAAELMGDLFTKFEEAGFTGHNTSVFLIRILFLMFGDDTRMWRRTERGLFGDIVFSSSADGAGLGGTLQELFQVLDTPKDKRPRTLSASLTEFPYVNGGIFSEDLPLFHFTKEMRDALQNACNYDWSSINPTIFGSLFQSVRDKDTRRVMGEHYTSEQNILRTINDLFLNDFHKQMLEAWDSPQALKHFRLSLADYRFADMACGSGNFLCVAYRRLRDIELRCLARLQELEGNQGRQQIDGAMGLSVHLGQFSGVEIDEWSASIARVAMWLTDHQANLALEEVNGSVPNRFPLTESANIVCGNALRIAWESVVEMGPKTFIMGNPPFFGARFQTPEQKQDTEYVFGKVKGVGNMDFVTNWHLLASRAIASHGGKAALVSTNSITQGEQPAILWGELYKLGIQIDFAHRTFSWANDAKGQAAVHVVIIGFSKSNSSKKNLWEYPDIKGQPVLREVDNINAYLLDSPNILITSRQKPISENTPPLCYGSQPNDGGAISDISPEEAKLIRLQDPVAAKYLRRLIGGRELIHNLERFCLWLVDVNPAELRSSPVLSDRIKQVREARLSSQRAATKKLADTPSLFGFINQPNTSYIAVPLISSENRDYLQANYISSDVIANNKIGMIQEDRLDIFGIIISRVFTVWNKAISGRLESRLNVSISITYNNFPFPALSEDQMREIISMSQSVLDSRNKYPSNSLAELYDPNAMPVDLRKAHQGLDKIVLSAFGLKSNASDEKILEVLFEKYNEAIQGLLYVVKKSKNKNT